MSSVLWLLYVCDMSSVLWLLYVMESVSRALQRPCHISTWYIDNMNINIDIDFYIYIVNKVAVENTHRVSMAEVEGEVLGHVRGVDENVEE